MFLSAIRRPLTQQGLSEHTGGKKQERANKDYLIYSFLGSLDKNMITSDLLMVNRTCLIGNSKQYLDSKDDTTCFFCLSLSFALSLSGTHTNRVRQRGRARERERLIQSDIFEE